MVKETDSGEKKKYIYIYIYSEKKQIVKKYRQWEKLQIAEEIYTVEIIHRGKNIQWKKIVKKNRQ